MTDEPTPPAPPAEPASAPVPVPEQAPPAVAPAPQAVVPPPEAPPADASDAPAAPAPAAPVEPPRSGDTTAVAGTRRAKPITTNVLRAAARTPKDVREIVELERKVKDTRAKRTVKGGSSVFASAVEATRPAAGAAAAPAPPAAIAPSSAVAPAAAAAPSASRPLAAPPPQPLPLPKTPAPIVPPAAPPRPIAETARAVLPAPPVGRPVVPAPPVPRPPQPAAAPASAPAPAAPQVVVTAPRSATWPVVLALLSSAAISGAALYLGARLVADALATARQASAVAPAPPPPAAPAPPTAGPGGQLAPIGGDRVIYTTAEGHLLVLRPDPASGELEVERAYSVTRDLERGMGEDTRQLHGYYLDDIEAARRAGIEAAQRHYEFSVIEAGENRASVASAKAAALALVRAGGADRLARDLAVEAGSGVSNMRRRLAALALGESGYVAAAPLLLELLRSESGDLLAEAVAALERLTGLDLEPARRAEAVAAVEAWLAARPAGRPFDRAEQR